MKIHCLIDRQGPTTVMYNGVRFDFVANEHGDCVCEVANPGASAYFLETFAGKYYQEYVEPVAVVVGQLIQVPTSFVDAGVDDEHMNGDVIPVFADDLETGDSIEPESPPLSAEDYAAKYAAIDDKDELVAAFHADWGVTLSKKYNLDNMRAQAQDYINAHKEA